MISKKFKFAKRDYLYLLERSFPQKGIIKLIGDRYKLSGTERTMLYRGITTKENTVHRKHKIAHVKDVKSSDLIIDGYNVMITIGNYLNGNTLFISNDGFLRDAAEMHGKVFRKVLMEKVMKLIIEDLRYLRIKNCIFYFDKPVSKSGELAARMSEQLIHAGIKGRAETADSPDYLLKRTKTGYIATSDSSIIDKSNVKVFDMARHVVARKFKPAFIDIR